MTTTLILIPHGATAWNLEGRVQGRAGPSLLPDSRRRLRQRRLPRRWRHWDVYTSPLRRARDSASALGLRPLASVRELAEMNWGRWQGRRLAELRAELGQAMADNEARGLDFRPPGGESPRQVRKRLRRWLARRARVGRPLVCVTHKGVIRAALSLATGWPLLGPPPLRLDWDCAHRFEINRQGRIYLRAANLALKSRTARSGPVSGHRS